VELNFVKVIQKNLQWEGISEFFSMELYVQIVGKTDK
jgi:hypothetical protein